MMPSDAVYELSTKSYTTDWNRAWVGGLGLFVAGTSAGLLVIESIEYFLRLPGSRLAPPWLILALVGAVPAGIAAIIAALRYRSRVVVAGMQGLEICGMFGNTRIAWEQVEGVEVRFVLGKPGSYAVIDNTSEMFTVWPAHIPRQRAAPTTGALPATPDQMAQIVSQRSGRPIREIRP